MVTHLHTMRETGVRSLGQGRSPGEGNGNPLQNSCLENPMEGGIWQATYSPWGRRELDTTERLTFSLFLSLLCEYDR